MKNFKLLMVLILALGFAATSCSKDDDTNNSVTTFKGSASITVDGKLYDKLASDVVEMNEGVTFFLEDNTDGGQFQLVITDVPEIGETVELSLASPEGASTLMLANGPIPNVITLIAGAGTVKRTSESDYEIDATLFGGNFFTDEYSISGTVEVGKYGY